MAITMSAQYGTLEINLFDNTGGVDTCVSCNAFKGAWIYCPVFNYIISDNEINFDETGEKNRCELFTRTDKGLNK